MKIRVQEQDRTFQISLPTNLIFNRFLLRLVLKQASADGSSGVKLSAAAATKLDSELKRIKKQYGTWELVEVQSTDGETVTIIL